MMLSNASENRIAVWTGAAGIVLGAVLVGAVVISAVALTLQHRDAARAPGELAPDAAALH